MNAKSRAELRARRVIDALIGATLGASAIVAAGLAQALIRPGQWTAIVVLFDAMALFTAVFVLLLGWALRRALLRAERVPWAGIAVWALVGVLPVVVFAVAHGLKVLRHLG